MMGFQLSTPVAFLIFNRPDTTYQVFEEIRRARPPTLLVVADGPRMSHPDDLEKSRATKNIIEGVDWPCTILKNYSDHNMGCRNRISSGLNWVFDQVPEAIVLEDDCLPHPDFFRFSEELLSKHRFDDRIAHISGSNFQFGRKVCDDSYYYSSYPHVWGWASWRRAWKYYDVDMKLWTENPDKDQFLQTFETDNEISFWRSILHQVSDKKIDTWDYQWTFACTVNRRLSISPGVNLISNIGFGNNATNTGKTSRLSKLPTEAMSFPLLHPSKLAPNRIADDNTRRLFYYYPSTSRRIAAKVKRGLSKLLR